MGEGIAYFHWRAWILQKYGPAYFDTEEGALATWAIKQSYQQDVARARDSLCALFEDL